MIQLQPAWMLSNKTTSLTSALIGRIEEAVDIRFQLPWNFGGYLRQIPRRLGTSPALDAASDALVASHRDFCTGRQLEPDAEVLNKQTRALALLRNELGDDVKARSSETLCAIMVLMITQLFIDPAYSAKISHVEGAARLLKSRGIIGQVNDFESALLWNLRSSVVAEALLNEDVGFTLQEWRTLVEQRIDTTSNHGKLIHCLAQLPALMKKSKAALRFGESAIICVPELVLDTRTLREQCKIIIEKLRHRLEICEEGELHPFEFKNHLHACRLRVMGLALAAGIILNCILSALDGITIDIRRENACFSDEMIKIARICSRYRPLGSMFFLSNLTFAWIGAFSRDRRERIKAMLIEYELECLGQNFTNWDLLLEQRRRRFTIDDASDSGTNKGHLRAGICGWDVGRGGLITGCIS
ncbi:MAG: hypothetical protein Q9226_004341 [Calogaya cf. arnoldii]